MVLILARLREVRAEMALLLESDSIASTSQTIVLPVLDFGKCRRNKREFYYRGHLYDIIHTCLLPAGQIAVTAICDQREQDVLNHLGMCLHPDNHSNQRHPAVAFFINLLTQTFILPDESQLSFIEQAFKKSHFFAIKDHYSTFHPFPVAAPPWRF